MTTDQLTRLLDFTPERDAIPNLSRPEARIIAAFMAKANFMPSVAPRYTECHCGARTENGVFIDTDRGILVPRLGLHRVAYHFHEVPIDQLADIRRLEITPYDGEIPEDWLVKPSRVAPTAY